MEIEFLGTGAGLPGKQRNVTSIALKLLDECNSIWLFDCGEATQQQILSTTIRPRKIEKIFISHLHGDHIFGLPGLLSSRSFQEGTAPLTIYGPKGIKEYVETSLRISESHVKYPLLFSEIEGEGVLFKDTKFEVSCLPLDHRIKSYGFRIREMDHQGELQVAKLAEMNIPSGPIYGKIKKGETVTLADGRIINGQDYVGPMQKGRIVTILGDTRSHANIERLAEGADVLVHESTYKHEEKAMAKAHFHSTTVQAAQIAKKTNVKRLLLTHISARYLSPDIKLMLKEAQEVFPNTRIVRDFDVYDIPFNKKE